MEIETTGLQLKTDDIIEIGGMEYKVSETHYNFDPFEPDIDDMTSQVINLEKLR